MKITIKKEDLATSDRYDYVSLFKQYIRDQLELLTELGFFIERHGVWITEDQTLVAISSRNFVRIACDFVEIV